METPAAEPSATCQFLLLPAEIRLLVYRFVFDLPRCVYIYSNEPLPRFLDPIETIIHTEILQTSRQIYREAAAVLYSELTVKLRAGNDLALGNPGPSLEYREPRTPYDKVWRHNPLLGVGHRNQDGIHIYDSTKMDGLMEPHVFARFQNVDFEVNAYFAEDKSWPRFCIGDDFSVVETKYENEFTSDLRNSMVIENIVKVISSSSWINQLRIYLGLDITAGWVGERKFSPYTRAEVVPVYAKMKRVAAIRAAKMVVDSGLLLPMRNLSNVKSFQLQFSTIDSTDKDHYDPPLEHKTISETLNRTIQDNWRFRQMAGESMQGA